METLPVDVAIFLNDKWVFVLNDRGEVLVFSSNGGLRGDLVSVAGFDIIGGDIEAQFSVEYLLDTSGPPLGNSPLQKVFDEGVQGLPLIHGIAYKAPVELGIEA